MRCREWYGWHFPELGKIITDNLVYAKVVQTLGERLVVDVYIFNIILSLFAKISKILLNVGTTLNAYN